MLAYDLTKRGSQPLYAYLYALIRADIERGVLRGGEKLPAKRTLAQQLGISQITVEGAYNQLLAEGYIYTKERRGTYISDLAALESSSTASASAANFGQRVAAAGTEEREVVNRTAGQAEVFSEKSFERSFTRSAERSFAKSVSFTGFPLRSWGKTMRAVLNQLPEAKLAAPAPPAGIPELRIAIARHLRQNRSLLADPQNILIGAGAQVLYGIIAQLLGKNNLYALEDPGYQRLTNLYAAQNIPTVHIPLDTEGIEIGRLRESKAQVAHIMPSHQYPSGLVTSASRRYEILAWALEKPNRYIIEDDYDCEYRLAGLPIPPLQSIDTGGRVIYTNTFSKTLGHSLRIAYAILPPPLMKKFQKNLSFYSSTVSTIEQFVLAKYIEDGAYERHLNRSRTSYRHVRDTIIAELNLEKYPDIKISHADSGLSFLLMIPSHWSLRRDMLGKFPAGMGCLADFSAAPPAQARRYERQLVVDYSGISKENAAQKGREMHHFLQKLLPEFSIAK